MQVGAFVGFVIGFFGGFALVGDHLFAPLVTALVAPPLAMLFAGALSRAHARRRRRRMRARRRARAARTRGAGHA